MGAAGLVAKAESQRDTLIEREAPGVDERVVRAGVVDREALQHGSTVPNPAASGRCGTRKNNGDTLQGVPSKPHHGGLNHRRAQAYAPAPPSAGAPPPSPMAFWAM